MISLRFGAFNPRRLIKLIAFSTTAVAIFVYAVLLLLAGRSYVPPSSSVDYARIAEDVGTGVGVIVAKALRERLGSVEEKTASRFSASMTASREGCENAGDGLECVLNVVEDAREFIRRKSDRKYTDEELVLQISTMLHEVEKDRKPPEPWSKQRLKQLDIHEENNISLPTWQIYQNRISKQGLFLSKDADIVVRLLRDLANLKIVGVEEIPDDGTQIKFVLLLEDGSRALFKPMRVARDDYETLDIYYMYEKERHTAEIAAFHLNRILGFNNVPPVAGRVLDMEEDLYEFLSEETRDQFFYSPVDNLCFFADCEYFCTAAHAVCGVVTKLEGSMAAFNPDEGPDENLENFWQRSYSKYNKSDWETAEDGSEYCSQVRTNSPYDNDKTMLNVIDTFVFDFLIGNKDRHHFYTFERYSNNSALVLFDNGKGFGRAYDDILDILTPLHHCCIIRYTTLSTLFALHTSSNPLSDRVRQSLKKDVLKNVLTEAHLRALDRRLAIVLETVLNCLRERPGRNIVIDDQYYYERG